MKGNRRQHNRIINSQSGDAMFNRDALLGKKNEGPNSDARSVNVTPGLGAAAPMRSPSGAQPESSKPTGSTTELAKKTTWEEPVGSKLVVGPDIKLRGVEITDCDTLIVEGRVEASMDSRVVQIAEHGVFSGTATMDVAEVWGRFEGELTARNHLIIHATGRVSGHIRYGSIRIEEGGELSGEVSTVALAQPTPRQSQDAAAPKATVAVTAYESLSAAKEKGKASASML
jgi:cytoskeletal protein CcmA (bactofilin family)